MSFFSVSLVALLLFTSSALCQNPTITTDDSLKAVPTTLLTETKTTESTVSTKTTKSAESTETESAKASKTEKIDPTATKKNASPTCTVVTATGLQTVIYTQYYSGTGFTENTNNPGNNQIGLVPYTTTFSGKDPICTVIQECANTSASFAFGYYSFQLYYLKSQKQYVCVSYANPNTDPSYFNVANADVTAAYGFSGMPVFRRLQIPPKDPRARPQSYEAVPWTRINANSPLGSINGTPKLQLRGSRLTPSKVLKFRNMTESTPPPVDVLIIGGGPAGLTAALTLARQRHTAVVFNSGHYRNASANHIHTVITWDHKDPEEFRAAARNNIASGYETIIFRDVAVETLRKTEDGSFEVTDTEGKLWTGKKVVLATGVRDIYPDIEGYDECWVTGIFHCLFCHGYEERFSASSGVLAVGDLANAPPAMHFARNAHQLTPNGVTIYTSGHDSLHDSLVSALGPESCIKVDSRVITRLEKGKHRAEVILHFSDGNHAIEGFLAHKPKCQLSGTFAQQLGLELTPHGDLKVTPPFYQTSLPGVFTAGDTTSPMKIAPNAMFTGGAAGAGVAAQLQAEAMGHKSMV